MLVSRLVAQVSFACIGNLRDDSDDDEEAQGSMQLCRHQVNPGERTFASQSHRTW